MSRYVPLSDREVWRIRVALTEFSQVNNDSRPEAARECFELLRKFQKEPSAFSLPTDVVHKLMAWSVQSR